jgi:poly-gamma-glutamate synthesis protein (capsule biosynthesis protein)
MIKLLAAGDFCPTGRLHKLIENRKYQLIFNNVPELIKSADYAFVNLECPIIEGNLKPQIKVGQNLSCNPNSIEALKYAGFSLVTLANNHIYDYGDEGVKTTIKHLKSNNIDFVGAGGDINKAERIFLVRIRNKTFAFLNFCEQEFSIASRDKGGANPLNPIKNYYQIREAKSYADNVIVIIHGGIEYFNLPSPRMQELYRFFVDAGSDTVINTHQHCFSGFEIYKEKPIFYGLGNFCFDMDENIIDAWNYGFLLSLNYSDNKIEFNMHPYIQCGHNASISLLDENSSFFGEIKKINEIISSETKLENAFNDFVKLHTEETLSTIEPYSGRFLRALYRRKLLPSLLSRKKLLEIRNRVECESHRDVLIKTFNYYEDKRAAT